MKKLIPTILISTFAINSFGADAPAVVDPMKQIRECIPLLSSLVAMDGREPRVSESPRIFAGFMLKDQRVFENPLFVYSALEVIKAGKIKDMVEGKFKADDISPELAVKIWSNFLKYFDPNEVDQDKIYASWTSANDKIKSFGQIDFESFKNWQDLSREFIFEPHKSELAVALIRNMMPKFLIYLDAWWDRYEIKREIKGWYSWGKMRAAGKMSGFVNSAEKTLVTEGPTDFEAFMGEAKLLPTTLAQFKAAMAQVINTEKFSAIVPKADLTDSKTASQFGTFMNPLILALSDSLMSVQQSHIRNVQMQNLKEQYPDGKLPEKIEHIDMRGLNGEIERERAKIMETHEKLAFLLKIEELVEKKIAEHLKLGHDLRKAGIKDNEGNPDQRIERAFLGRLESLEKLAQMMNQIITTTGFVMDSLKVDRAYLDTLGLTISEAHISEALEGTNKKQALKAPDKQKVTK